MILTEDEFEELQNMEFSQNDWLWFYTQAVENKLLEKLKVQEPVGWWNGKETAFFEHETDSPVGEVNIPIYLHPLPPDDVVRDAERYRWLREQHWTYGTLTVTKPEYVVLGGRTYSEHPLDEIIDAAMEEMK